MEGEDEMLGLQGNLEQVQVTAGHVPGWLKFLVCPRDSQRKTHAEL